MIIRFITNCQQIFNNKLLKPQPSIFPTLSQYSIMEKSTRPPKPIYEKENQQKLVNKRTDLLSSFNNIKLPLQPSNCYKENRFQSVPTINSIAIEPQSPAQLASERQFKLPKLNKQSSLTQEYCKTYGIQVEYALSKQSSKGKFLSNHKIDGILRARMLDWMVQVMCSYNFQNKTYFAGVEIMDRFFANCTETLLPTQLHIIGVQSMFIATKMEQVYPLKMKTVYDKIAHKKISIFELVEMEQKIISTLNFQMVSASFYDLAVTKIARHLTQSQSYSDGVMKQIEDICNCLGKYMCYNYDLMILFDKETLAITLANYVLDIYKLPRLSRPTSSQIQCKEFIVDSITNFKRKYKGLNNLIKFTDKKVLEIIEESII